MQSTSLLIPVTTSGKEAQSIRVGTWLTKRKVVAFGGWAEKSREIGGSVEQGKEVSCSEYG